MYNNRRLLWQYRYVFEQCEHIHVTQHNNKYINVQLVQ